MWRALAVFAALLVSSLVAAPSAFAGTLEVNDAAHILTPEGVDALRKAVSTLPFDAKLTTTAEYNESSALGSYVGSLISEPTMVVVGIDPTHHHVAVHFGKGAGIPRDSWDAIEHAGNLQFHARDWAGGAESIFRRAAASASPVEASKPSPLSGVGAFVIVALIVGGVVWLFARRRATAGFGGGAPYGAAGGYGGGPPFGPGPYPGGPMQGGGMGPVGGGLIGAGLGGLAGYELGKMEGERERRDPGLDQGGGNSNAGFGDGGSYDAGGGTSSFDDGGGNDGGGGGGDFGGGDGGGGGGDF